MMSTRETDKAEGIDNARDRILCDPLHSNRPTEGDVGKPTKGAVDWILRMMDNQSRMNMQEFHDPGPYREMYKFIVEGLLNAVEGSPVRNALDSIHCDNVCSLIELIRKPGLIVSLRWNGEKLSDEQCRELLALDSFINDVRNESRDITTKTRKDFLHFMHEEEYDGIDDHIAFSEEKRAGCHEHLTRMMGIRGSKKYKPVSDRIVQLFETIDTVLDECPEVYQTFQSWDTIKLLPDNDPNEGAREYIRRVFLSQDTKSLRRGDELSTVEGDKVDDGVTSHASVGTTTTSQTSPSLNNDSSNVKSCEDEAIDEAGENGENATDTKQGVMNSDCTPEKNNVSQECALVTEDVTQDVSEDSTNADGECQLKEGVRTCAQFYSRFEFKGGETKKGKEDWGADMPNLNERFSKYMRDVVIPFAMKDWRWILNFVRMWGSWTLIVNWWCVMLAMIMLGPVVLRTRITMATTDNDYGQYRSPDTAYVVRTNDSYAGGSDDDHINGSNIMPLGERSIKWEQSIPLGSAQKYGESLHDQSVIVRIRPLNGNTALGCGVRNDYAYDCYMISSCLENNASSRCINTEVYGVDLPIDNDMLVERWHHVELSQGIKNVLRGNQQWMWGESPGTQSYGMCIIEHPDSNIASCRIYEFVNCGINDSSGVSSPLHDKSPSAGGSDIDVCALIGHVIAAFDDDNANAGHAIGSSRIIPHGNKECNAAKIDADGKANSHGEKCDSGNTIYGIDIAMDDVDHDDVFPTGDDSKYFDKEGQIINGKVLAADKCAHSIDMVAVHRNIEDVAGHAENINIGSRILQQIRETGSGTNAQLKMHCVVKHDGRCKAKIVVERVLCHNVNTITMDVELLGTYNTRRWRNKSNNQERNILVDGEHIWNINRSGSNNMYAYNHVSTDCINKNTCYGGSLIILAKGINRYIGEYARRNIKTAGIQNIKTAVVIVVNTELATCACVCEVLDSK